MRDTDSALLIRLRDLSLVNLDALVAGASESRYTQLLDSYAADLGHAIGAARARMGELLSTATAGPDPLAVVDLPAQTHAQDGGRQAGERAAVRLSERAVACRTLAIFDDLSGQLIPKLLEVDRRRS